MKKILSLFIAAAIIVLPSIVMAGGTPKKINSKTFHMVFEGKQSIETSYKNFYIYRYYDPQTPAMCYVVLDKNTNSSIYQIINMSCVRIKKRWKNV